MPLVTIIVPVLADTDVVGRLLAEIQPNPDVEVVVVDGGGDERLTQIVAARPSVTLLRTAKGRGLQMNRGAAAASGTWLLFLHADSRPPLGWREALASLGPEISGGWFRFALDDDAWQARVIETLVAWRVRWFRLPYGDQGLFVRRVVFEQLGGFAELPLFEDVELVRRLARGMRVVELPLPLVTSARRWRRDGWFRRSGRNLCLTTLYFAGISPARLARWYLRR